MSTDGHLDLHVTEDAAEETAADAPFSMLLELVVHDRETIEELQAYSEGEPRDRFALSALRIGVLALKQARGRIDADLVRTESERWLGELRNHLQRHSESLFDRLGGTLKEYFDPQSGRFQERVERLLQEDGELESFLRKQIGAGDSELARTLTAHIGNDSPLMKLLHPEQSDGLVARFRETFEQQLQTQREHVLKQFSLDEKEGALSRFIAELTDRQGELTEQLDAKIDDVVREFSLDEDDSALSRLVRNVEHAQKTITREFSLDEDGSALARLQKQLRELLEAEQKRNRDFQEEVRQTLAEMKVRREEAARSTRHGCDFEELVFEQVQRLAQPAGDVASHTGNTTGLIKNRKVGDFLIELGPEHRAAGARIAGEAKEKSGYDLRTAREEIETARKNRAAEVGLFVFSKKTAPAGLKPVTRYAGDVFVVWDAEDAASDLYLDVGLSLAQALCVRRAEEQEARAIDFDEIDRAILAIEKQAGSLDDIETWTGTIRSNSDKILKKLATARTSLQKQVEQLRERIVDVKGTLATDDAPSA